jgi:hypothetical protein
MGSGSASRFCLFLSVSTPLFSLGPSCASAGASDMAASSTGAGDLTSPLAWRFLVLRGAASLDGPPSKTSNISSSMVGEAECALWVREVICGGVAHMRRNRAGHAWARSKKSVHRPAGPLLPRHMRVGREAALIEPPTPAPQPLLSTTPPKYAPALRQLRRTLTAQDARPCYLPRRIGPNPRRSPRLPVHPRPVRQPIPLPRGPAQQLAI